MNHYFTSTGERVSKAEIDRKVRKAKELVIEAQKDLYGYNFCQVCGRNGSQTYLDCSHIVSVDECQKTRRAELAWAPANIQVLCRKCHQKRDKLNLQFSKK